MEDQKTRCGRARRWLTMGVVDSKIPGTATEAAISIYYTTLYDHDVCTTLGSDLRVIPSN